MATTEMRTPSRIMPQQFQRRTEHRAGHVNVGDTERWASILGGGALAVFGLSRESLPGLALAALGGTLVYRGMTGHCPVYCALDMDHSGRGPATTIPARQGVKVEEAMTINRSPHDLYEFCATWKICRIS